MDGGVYFRLRQTWVAPNRHKLISDLYDRRHLCRTRRDQSRLRADRRRDRQADKEEVKKEEPKAEVKAAAPEAVKAPEAKKKEDAAEKPANCASCNKSIKNKRWYYRNGKYYCSKRCWQTAAKKEKAPAQAQETPQK